LARRWTWGSSEPMRSSRSNGVLPIRERLCSPSLWDTGGSSSASFGV